MLTAAAMRPTERSLGKLGLDQIEHRLQARKLIAKSTVIGTRHWVHVD